METKTLKERLREEVGFGDLVEVTLADGKFVANHNKNGIYVLRNPENQDETSQDEFGILYVSGYYGGLRSDCFKEVMAISDGKVSPVLIISGEEQEKVYLCLDPTIHRKNSIRDLKFNGAGLVKIPVSEIVSFSVLSKKRRDLRVVN